MVVGPVGAFYGGGSSAFAEGAWWIEGSGWEDDRLKPVLRGDCLREGVEVEIEV